MLITLHPSAQQTTIYKEKEKKAKRWKTDVEMLKECS